ncbi:MAG: hypothetical protein U0790_22445 [Isosphaeraceae bacterium]
MKWFKGKLYVGTNRDFQCVENATLAFYFPQVIPLQSVFQDPDVPCPADPSDLDLRAEIWRYTPETQTWDRVYQSEVIPNPSAPGKSIARDIGYRDMVEFRERDGTNALYILGCTAREYTPGLPPPRILRMTVATDPETGQDHEVFEPVPQDPGTTLGELNAITYRASAVYKNRLYVTASAGLTGDGYILESTNPREGNNSFRQVSPSNFHVYELAVMGEYLYVGAGDQNLGYSVWKTRAEGPLPYAAIPVVTLGGGRGSAMTSVVSMYPFKGRLYVGCAGWFSFVLPSSELIRINADDSWELVSGSPRSTNRGFLFPISGLGDGFGNPFNAHIWRMQDHNGVLYAGTNDDSWGLRHTFLDPYFRYQYGFDLFASTDGVYWTPVSRTGFGNPFTFGLRTFASTPAGLFVGTVNYAQGTEVWLGRDSSSVQTGSAMQAGALTKPLSAGKTIAAPGQLDAEPGGKTTILSWAPAPGAAQYRVYRSTSRATDLGFFLGVAPTANSQGGGPSKREVSSGVFQIPTQFVLIAETAEPFYEDRSPARGSFHSYYVQAVDTRHRLSTTSNVISTSALGPPVTFEQAIAECRAVASAEEIGDRALVTLDERLDRGRSAVSRGDLSAAKGELDWIRAQLSSPDKRPIGRTRREEIALVVDKLSRRVDLAARGAISAEDLIGNPGPLVRRSGQRINGSAGAR